MQKHCRSTAEGALVDAPGLGVETLTLWGVDVVYRTVLTAIKPYLFVSLFHLSENLAGLTERYCRCTGEEVDVVTLRGALAIVKRQCLPLMDADVAETLAILNEQKMPIAETIEEVTFEVDP